MSAENLHPSLQSGQAPPAESLRDEAQRCRRPWYRSLHRKMSRALGLFRFPWLEDVQIGYEKAGMTVFGEPIPWNAEAVLVEALLWGGSREEKRPEAFSLRLPYSFFGPSTSVSCEEEGLVRLTFRLPPIKQSTWADLCWRSLPLRRLHLPFLGLADFLESLHIVAPTLFACFGDHQVACAAVVPHHCDGLLATGLLTSPTSLLPVLDLNPRIEWTSCETRRQGDKETRRPKLRSPCLLVSLSPCLLRPAPWN